MSEIRRRLMAPSDDEWEVLIHNDFSTKYVAYKGTNGNTFVPQDNGEWVEIVSNGLNQNTSNLTTKPTFDYNPLKDKLCRLTWNIECSNPSVYTPETGAGNITLGTYNTRTPSQAGSGRVGKLDFVRLQDGNLIGYHQKTFIPSEVLANVSKSTYWGWNFGFRSSVEGLVWRIMELTLEVHK